MAKVRTFRDLIAWQKGMALAKEVYQATRGLPKEEMYGLTMQIRRSAVSVPSNIAEGHGRASRQDYLRFLRVARGSLAELATQMELATQIGMIQPGAAFTPLQQETGGVLQGLITSLEQTEAQADPTKQR